MESQSHVSVISVSSWLNSPTRKRTAPPSCEDTSHALQLRSWQKGSCSGWHVRDVLSKASFMTRSHVCLIRWRWALLQQRLSERSMGWSTLSELHRMCCVSLRVTSKSQDIVKCWISTTSNLPHGSDFWFYILLDDPPKSALCIVIKLCSLFLQTPTPVHPETGLVSKGSPSLTHLSWETTGLLALSSPRIRSSPPAKRPTAERCTSSPTSTTRPLAPRQRLLPPCWPYCWQYLSLATTWCDGKSKVAVFRKHLF